MRSATIVPSSLVSIKQKLGAALPVSKTTPLVVAGTMEYRNLPSYSFLRQS